MICPRMSSAIFNEVENVFENDGRMTQKINTDELMVECKKENCMFWIKVINPLTGTAQDGCADNLKAQALNDIAVELKRKNS